MALTRKLLKSMGIDDEKIDQIIEEHVETVNALKEQRDSFKEAAEKAEDLQRQLDEKGAGEDFKKKYDDLKAEFDDYKAGVESEQTRAKVKSAYENLLKEAGIAEKRVAVVMRATDLSEIKLNQDGSIRGADSLKKQIEDEWGDFIVSTEERGQKVDNPPTESGKKMTREEISKIKDTAERQKAIAENHELYGF